MKYLLLLTLAISISVCSQNERKIFGESYAKEELQSALSKQSQHNVIDGKTLVIKDSDVNEDNDCHIAINKISNEIVEFNFRTDLRNVKNIHKFLTGMLKICEENGLVLIDNERYILEPKLEIIMKKIKKSRAVEFLNDPKRFLDKVISENKNIR